MKQQVENIRQKYSHLINPIALIGGFIIDIFTLNQIDQIFDNAILITHLIIVITAISLLFSKGTDFGKRALTEKRTSWLETLMVFSFGALFSGFVIFYTRSGSLITSWPFILAMIALMLGTEFRKKYFYRLRLQIIILSIAILSWSIFFVPVVIKKMGPWIFILSIFIGVIIISSFLILLQKINKPLLQKHIEKIIIRIVAIVTLFNVLYFTNIMPPIPLSLKYKAIYYEVERTHSGYQAQYERTPWYIFWQKRSSDMYWRNGEDIYMFTQVFAPTELSTVINHVWEQYNPETRRWMLRDTIELSITGGRADGYRGFTKKSNLEYGTWRVKTQTKNGQTLGVKRFSIHRYGTHMRELITEEL